MDTICPPYSHALQLKEKEMAYVVWALVVLLGDGCFSGFYALKENLGFNL